MVIRRWFLAGVQVICAMLVPWRASAAGPYQFYPITPCRLADTRGTVGLNGGPALAAGDIRNFQVTNFSPCGVPMTAQAAALNVTMVGPTGAGFLVVWPYNTGVPGTSNINADAGTGAIANGCLVALTTIAGNLNISISYGSAPGNTTNVIVDITGYYQ